MESNIKETHKNELKSIKTPVKEKHNDFFPLSNYPMREYVNFLRFQNGQLTKEKENQKLSKIIVDLIDEKIAANNRKIKGYRNNSFWYDIMDMIYAGEQERAKQLCAPAVLQECMNCLLHMSEKDKVVYSDFTERYRMESEFAKKK